MTSWLERSARLRSSRGIEEGLLNAGNVPDVALDDCLDVVQMPVPSAVPSGACQRLRISASEDGLHEVVADNEGRDIRRRASERSFEEPRRVAAYLCLREWKQSDDAHATGKGSRQRAAAS